WQPSFNYVLTLPSVAGSGNAASATLTIYDSNYNLATSYTGTVHFTSTDGAATLPVDYTFTGGDAGAHTFTNGFILRTPGSQIVTSQDTLQPTITASNGVTVGPPTPVGLNAAAVSTTQINLTWNPSTGATQYEVFRASAGSGYTSRTVTASTNFSDSTVTAGNTYLYKVRALDSSSRPSPLSAPDAATTIFFTNDPLAGGATAMKAAHITELRQAVNAMNAAAGLGTTTFTDSSLVVGITIKAVHVQELRAALATARSVLGLLTIGFTDPTLVVGTTIAKAAHIQELRNGIK